MRAEIQKAEPYPGGRRWQSQLRDLQTKLAQSGGGPRRFRWFEQAIEGFADRKKGDALRILDDLQRRLSLLEESLPTREKRSPEEIKSLLRDSEGRKIKRDQPRQQVEAERPEIRGEEARGKEGQGDAPHAHGGRGTPVSVPPSSGGGLSFLGWLLLGGLALAVVVLGILLYLTSPRTPNPKKGESATLAAGLSPENDARQILEKSPAALWQKADTLAGDGRFRDAVRVMYLAVLALLHRHHLIRFEPMRTNGEYVRQVRLSERAPPELCEPFEQLTHLFETACYGERPCEAGDYGACRSLADVMQQVAIRL